MRIRRRSDQINLAGVCRAPGNILALVIASGCSVILSPSPDAEPDMSAIVKVVNDACRTQGFDRPVLFLNTGEVCESVLPSSVSPDGGVFPALKTQLEMQLQVKVRSLSDADFSDPSVPALTPVLPETLPLLTTLTAGIPRPFGWNRVRPEQTVSRTVSSAGSMSQPISLAMG